MNCFIVISQNTEKIQAAVQKHFPDFNYQIVSGTWVVASDSAGPSDVCKTLGIDVEGEVSSGVVCSLNSYYGFFDAALWEKLNLWEAQ